MIQIRPVSDLRNKFAELEKVVGNGEPVYLTKNGYGTMVLMSIDAYSRIIDPVETALDEADAVAETTSARMEHNEVFSKIRSRVNG